MAASRDSGWRCRDMRVCRGRRARLRDGSDLARWRWCHATASRITDPARLKQLNGGGLACWQVGMRWLRCDGQTHCDDVRAIVASEFSVYGLSREEVRNVMICLRQLCDSVEVWYGRVSWQQMCC